MFLKERAREESREAVRCKELLSGRISEFVEEVLFSKFEGLVRFVKDCEILLTKGQNQALGNEERKSKNFFFFFFWNYSLFYLSKFERKHLDYLKLNIGNIFE